jgi:hypothetical protein
MADKSIPPRLKDGTLVEHKTNGYRGRIEGITEIKSCFTRAGAALAFGKTDETFQYRVVINGEARRRIAPQEDLEILFEEVAMNVCCFNCHAVFRNNPAVANKSGGRCDCGGWICPACFACQAPSDKPEIHQDRCAKQTQRMKRKRSKKAPAASARLLTR